MQVIAITGMHRSGTSLVTSWLERCGLQISDGQILPASVDNAKGHFEDREFVRLHLNNLAVLFPQSKGWILQNKTQVQKLCLDVNKQKDLIERRSQKYPLWGWKDPRTLFFLECWQSVLPSMNTLLLWRPCDEVVDSLLRRSRRRKEGVLNITLFQAIRLWTLSNQVALDYLSRHPERTVLINLYEILNHERPFINLLNQKFGVSLTYHPLTDLDTPAFLHHKPSPAISILTRVSFKITQITKDLQEASCYFPHE